MMKVTQRTMSLTIATAEYIKGPITKPADEVLLQMHSTWAKQAKSPPSTKSGTIDGEVGIAVIGLSCECLIKRSSQ